jgi:hypothetical protein
MSVTVVQLTAVAGAGLALGVSFIVSALARNEHPWRA